MGPISNGVLPPRASRLYDQHMSGAPRFRLAIIGAGEAAGTMHLPAALASEMVELAALVDPMVERAEALARKYGVRPEIGQCIGDIRGLVEGAIIATPNDTHRDLFVACAARGIPASSRNPWRHVSKTPRRFAEGQRRTGS
jgi:predicted dehydrogenase